MRQDIQALRGFAILAVFLYHLNLSFIPGGFLGVDIFFVISGFVITTSLLHGSGSPLQRLKNFYLRRAKRILPASLTVVFLTAIGALFLLPAYSRSRYSFEALASSLFSANLNFAREGNDYLNQSLDPSPFLHYWSLGVEEQFYLLWPILFIFIFRKRRHLIVPTFLVSIAIAFAITSANPVMGFYSPITRAWEFLAGIFFALHPIRFSRGRLVAFLGWLGMIGSVLAITVDSITPGWSTLIPVISTALIIGSHREFPRSAFLPWLGNYSFSLYLVHWPLIIFIPNKLIVVLVALPIAVLVTKSVENPFRFNPQLQFSLKQWGTGIAVVSILSYGVLAIPAQAKSSLDLSLPAVYNNGCHLSFNKTWPDHSCTFGDSAGKKLIYLVGDSHAAQWFPGLEAAAIKNDWRLVSITKSSCPPVLIPILRNNKVDTSCENWQKGVISSIRKNQPDVLLLSAFTEFQYQTTLKGSYEELWRQGMGDFLSQIGVPNIAFLGDTPKPPSNIPTCLSKSKHCDFPLTRTAATKVTQTVFGVNYIDTSSWFCSTLCSAMTDGINNYRDATHISVSASLRMEHKLVQAINSLA